MTGAYGPLHGRPRGVGSMGGARVDPGAVPSLSSPRRTPARTATAELDLLWAGSTALKGARTLRCAGLSGKPSVALFARVPDLVRPCLPRGPNHSNPRRGNAPASPLSASCRTLGFRGGLGISGPTWSGHGRGLMLSRLSTIRRTLGSVSQVGTRSPEGGCLVPPSSSPAASPSGMDKRIAYAASLVRRPENTSW